MSAFYDLNEFNWFRVAINGLGLSARRILVSVAERQLREEQTCDECNVEEVNGYEDNIEEGNPAERQLQEKQTCNEYSIEEVNGYEDSIKKGNPVER